MKLICNNQTLMYPPKEGRRWCRLFRVYDPNCSKQCPCYLKFASTPEMYEE